MFPLRDTIYSEKRPVVTYLLIALNSFVFLWEIVSPQEVVLRYALVPNQVDFSNLRTLLPFLTSLFLHAGWVHLFSNMWFLRIFGDNVEAFFGRLKFLFFYLLWGIIACFVQYLFLMHSSIPMLGASGAIAGVLGAYLVLFPYSKIETLVPTFAFWARVFLPAPLMLIYWFFIQLFNGTASIIVGTAVVGGVAWWAHIGGFLGGFLTTKSFFKRQEEILYPEEIWF